MLKNQSDNFDMIDWSARISAAMDIETLDAIDRQLASLEPDARKWRFAVVARKRALKSSSPIAPPVALPAPAISPADTSFATKFNVERVDGRRLHAYRLGQADFEALQRLLASRQDYHALEQNHFPGLFVLWASEWFRRSYRGGPRRWESLTQALGFHPPSQAGQNVLRDITRKGLTQWGRPVYATDMNHFLATLAREGGFPACAVADGGKGWARAVLEAIVGQLMGISQPGEAEALDFAKGQQSRMPGVFSDAEFVTLCADLALAIVRLRHAFEPQAQATGIPLAAWLALNVPDWRQRLPLSTGEANADSLVETLIAVPPVTGSGIGVDRLLVRDGEGAAWQEAVRIDLDGEISSGAMAAIDGSLGRLRAFAAGQTARYLSGELAMFDPPGLGEKAWFVRSGRRARGVLPLPLQCPVQLDLRAGDRQVASIELPGGKPRRGQMLVAVRDDSLEGVPRALRIVGSGSGSYRSVSVFLIVPINWVVRSLDHGEVERLGPGIGETAIWHVHGGARIIDPYNDCYQLLCGQPADQTARISFDGSAATWAEVKGAVDLFVGPPQISRDREGDLFIRPLGMRNWRGVPRELPVGHYEIGWRKDGIMQDRRRIAVLPKTVEFNVVHHVDGAQFALGGFGGVRIIPASDAPVRPTSDGSRWLPRPHAAGVYRFDATIEWPDGASLSVSIAYPGDACIATRNGRRLAHGTRLTLDDMPDLVAIDRGDMTLMASLRDVRRSTRAEMFWSFSGEMQMNAVRDDIASLLLPASLDAEVLLDMNDGINTNWIVCKFPLELQEEASGFVASEAILGQAVEFCGRPIVDPSHETSFGAYTLLSEANHRPVNLPEGTAGDWLVFLREGERVLTRPRYVRLSREAAEPTGPLGQAMAHAFGAPQDAALQAFLADAQREDDHGRACLRALIELTAGLRGLPPETFNLFKHLHLFPGVLARMAFHASEAQRDAVLGLSLALPFAWFTIPMGCWKEAEHSIGRAAIEMLAMLPDAPRFALTMVHGIKQSVVDRAPLLAAVFGSAPSVSLEDAAQAFLRRARHGLPSQGGDRYRPRLKSRLPSYFARFDPAVLDILDAPCAAALAAKGEWTPETADVRHLKLVARSYPNWFAEAFAACVKDPI